MKARIGQIVIMNLFVSLPLNSLTIAYMAWINGAQTFDKIIDVVRQTFWAVNRTTWIVQPVLITFAQKYLPPETWEPFFALVRFFLSTYFNT